MVIVGTDRVTANGDVANKIGTYLKALAAKDNSVPFYVALPSSTIDWTLESGRDIPIEERSEDEVLKMAGRLPDGSVTVVEIAAPGSRRRQSRLRRHAGPAGDRLHHRTRHLRRHPRRLTQPVSRNAGSSRPCSPNGPTPTREKFVSDYAGKGVNEDLALRTYTTRLLGRTPSWCCMAAATPRSRPRSRTCWAKMWR